MIIKTVSTMGRFAIYPKQLVEVLSLDSDSKTAMWVAILIHDPFQFH